MNDDSPLPYLILHTMMLSLLAIGGVGPILPELHRIIVVENGWLTGEQFTALFALAQAAPGPNFIFVTLIGLHLFGMVGALSLTAAISGPAMVIAYAAARLAKAWDKQLWFRLVRAGMVPMTTGLMIASAWLLTDAAARGPFSYVITGVTAAILLTTRINPLVLLAIAGGLGIAGLV